MRYTVNAWLENGEPRLGIVGLESGVVQHQWRLSRVDDVSQSRGARRRNNGDVQQLLKELFIVACAEEISLLQRARSGNPGEVCLFCDECIKQIATDGVVDGELTKRRTR